MFPIWMARIAGQNVARRAALSRMARRARAIENLQDNRKRKATKSTKPAIAKPYKGCDVTPKTSTKNKTDFSPCGKFGVRVPPRKKPNFKEGPRYRVYGEKRASKKRSK